MQSRAQRLAAQLSSRVAPGDVALAAVVLLASFFAPPAGRAGEVAGLDPAALASRGWPSTVMVVLAALLLVWRGRWPEPVWIAILALTAADTLYTELPSRCLMALMVSVYSVAVRTNRRTAVAVAAITAVVLIIPTLFVTGTSLGSDATYALAAFSALAAAVGDSVRNQGTAMQAAIERAEAAEASRDEEALRRVAEERLRISRELHDAVAHHVSVINVQAGVASHLLESDTAAARAALTHVRTAAQQVIEEMRTMVGLLRTDEQAQLVEPPTPGLAQVGELVTRMRSAGLEVDFVDQPGVARVPAAVGLTAYRVIQEGLTNAAKHGSGAAALAVREEGPNLHIEITNPVTGSTGRGVPSLGGSGHGLIGMRERVAAAGGILRVTTGSPFVVSADLPLARFTQ